MMGLLKPTARVRTPALAVALLAGAWWLVLATTAFAAGTFSLRSTSVNEVSGGWHIYCTVGLPKAPLIPHQTLKFLFTKTAVFERDLVDNNPNPVVNRTSLTGQNPSVESLDVDFSDPSGKVYPVTHFDFSLSRVRGYEAGEYKLQVRTSDDVPLGAPTTIVLNGDNPVVDRRAMTFDAKKSGVKKIAGGVDGGTAPPKVDESSAAVPNNGEVVPAASAPPFLSADAFKTQPEELHDHPKGCGCDVPGIDPAGLGGGTQAAGALFTGLGLSLIAWRKRRTR